MITVFDELAADPPEYDVCIVGSGPAGMTVAAELKDSGLRVCVLESGRLKTTPQGDRLRAVESAGIVIKEYSRERVLGGASTTWAGLSSPFDRIDVEPRPWIGSPGWPIGHDELLRWYEAAQRYRFPALAMFAPGGLDRLRERGEVLPRWSRIDEKVFLACSEPQDFGAEQRAIFAGDGVDLYLDATVLRLESDPAVRRIVCAVARGGAGPERRVRARVFVVAAGGIENARLLLNSRDLCEAGLGNEHDQVGRWFMNHPKNYGGVIDLHRPVRNAPYYFGCLFQGYAGYAGLRLREDEQRRRGLLNSYVRLEPLFPWSDNKGVEALVLLVKRTRFLLRRFQERRRGQVTELRDYSETGDDSALQNERKGVLGWIGVGLLVIVHLPAVARYAWSRLFERKAPLVRRVRLRNFLEMEPRPDNRVTLSEQRDAYGQPIPRVEHRCSALDQRSLVALHDALREELERSGVGRLESDLRVGEPWPIDQDASHHMGATRMGTDPATSVVDPDCRIHTAENVYLAGASVFPTSGCANPTFTLVALAMRLAHHLKHEVLARSESARVTWQSDESS